VSREKTFPLPFASSRVINGGRESSYVVGAMFTRGYAPKAARLAASCDRFSLHYEMHEVPAVHRSLSIRGGDDLSFTKANFIRFLLRKHRKPVLYIDADCEIVARPELVGELVRTRCDFAVYNWLADEYADRFHPVDEMFLPDRPAVKNRYFRYKGCLGLYSTRQLVCSGLVQFYRNSMAARALLSKWQDAIAAFPGCADDQCLDFAYNNLTRRSPAAWMLKACWLPKAYARVAFWIYAEPVINHPDFPSPVTNFAPIEDPRGRKRYYPSLAERRKPALLLPRDCIIDTEDGTLCRVVDGKLVAVGRTEQKFWIARSEAEA
jgi:hypothetical protein